MNQTKIFLKIRVDTAKAKKESMEPFLLKVKYLRPKNETKNAVKNAMVVMKFAFKAVVKTSTVVTTRSTTVDIPPTITKRMSSKKFFLPFAFWFANSERFVFSVFISLSCYMTSLHWF